jgi:hypothetical protein
MSLPIFHPAIPSERPAGNPNDLIWRLSVEQYHEMIRTGILTSDDPVELLEGWLIYKTPKSPRHSVSTRVTRRALEGVVPDGWYVDTQEPITLDDSEPEPDVMLVRARVEIISSDIRDRATWRSWWRLQTRASTVIEESRSELTREPVFPSIGSSICESGGLRFTPSPQDPKTNRTIDSTTTILQTTRCRCNSRSRNRVNPRAGVAC